MLRLIFTVFNQIRYEHSYQKDKARIACLIFLVAEMASPFHDLRRREWALSASAAGGGESEREKGENKEQTARATRSSRRRLYFRVGLSNPTSAEQGECRAEQVQARADDYANGA